MNGVPAPTGGPPTDAASAPATSVRWRILAILFAYSFMSWFNRISMTVAGDEHIMKEYGISKPAMGMVYSALLLSYTILMAPGGWLTDRFGPWFGLVLMGLGSAFFCASTGIVGWLVFSGSVLWLNLIVIRFLMGIFTAPLYPSCSRAVANWFPFPQHARMNGLVLGAALLGNASTFFGFGKLIDVFGWEMAFVITGGVTGALALAWWAYARSHPAQHGTVNRAEHDWIRGDGTGTSLPGSGDRMSLRDLRLLFRNRSLILLTVSYAAVGYFEYLFYFWLRNYFLDVLDLGKDFSRAAATIANLGMALGMFAGGYLADWCMRRFGYRKGRVLVPVGGMIASAFILVLALITPDPRWKVVWFTLAMAAAGTCEGPMWATALDLGGKHGATAAGIFNTGGNALGLVAPVVTPLISEAWGWGWGIGMGGIVCLLGAILFFWIDPSERCREEAESNERRPSGSGKSAY
jgi:sugar phosphate permease